MLISVIGTSGLGQVPGVSADRPAGLLEAVANRPDRTVLVLTPQYAERAARRQADLLIAARPTAWVRVVVSTHHALTLTVAADRVARSGVESGEDAERALTVLLEEAHSLAWSPTLWRCSAAGLGLLTRLRSLAEKPGFLLELGPDGRLTDARCDWQQVPDLRLCGVETPPVLLSSQLGAHRLQQVGTRVHPGAPYAAKGVRLLTAMPPDPARNRLTEPARAQPSRDAIPTPHENESEAA